MRNAVRTWCCAIVAGVFVLVLVSGCGGLRPYSPNQLGGSGGSFTVAVRPEVLRVYNVGDQKVEIILTSVGGWSGDVSLTFEGLPSSCTGRVDSPVHIGSNETRRVWGIINRATFPPYGTYAYFVRGTSGSLSASGKGYLELTD
jgi:hypothetical protein